MHLVRCGHLPSRDEDGGHTIGSVIPERPMLYANIMALAFTELELWEMEVYIVGMGIFDLDLDPMIFIYKLDLYSLKIHRDVQI